MHSNGYSNAIDVLSFCLWWYGFSLLAANPRDAAVVSVITWVTTWAYLWTINLHPIKCRITPSQRMFLFGTILSLLTAQYIATCWSLAVKRGEGLGGLFFQNLVEHPDDPSPTYDCVRTAMDGYTGNASCSVEAICTSQ